MPRHIPVYFSVPLSDDFEKLGHQLSAYGQLHKEIAEKLKPFGVELPAPKIEDVKAASPVYTGKRRGRKPKEPVVVGLAAAAE